MPTPHYHINLFYSPEDRAFIADIPDLRFCSAHGPTPQVALREVLIAQRLWLRAARAQGKADPKPRYRPAPALNEPTKTKPYTQMNTAELREATKHFDHPSPPGASRPLTPGQRAKWNRMKRKQPRP